MLKLQRTAGFALPELKLLARLCGPYTVAAADAATSLLRLSVDYDAFVHVLRGLVPQWSNDGKSDDGTPCLLERLFAIFRQLPAEGVERGADLGSATLAHEVSLEREGSEREGSERESVLGDSLEGAADLPLTSDGGD